MGKKSRKKDMLNLHVENMTLMPNEKKKEVYSNLTTIIGTVCINEGKAEVSC